MKIGCFTCNILLPLASALLIFSCHNSPDQSTVIEEKKLFDTIQHKPGSSYDDTITINFPAAVFFNPDSLQLLQVKKKTDSLQFESALHEYFYQQRNAKMVIEKSYSRIKIIAIQNARYLLFIKKDKTTEIIDLNMLDDLSGIILFDGHQPPKLADMMNIETELGFYFKK